MYNLLVAQNFFHNKHFNFFQNTFDIIVIYFISYFLDVVLRPMADPRQVSSSLLASDSPMSSSKWQIFLRENIDSNMFTSNYLNSLIYSFKSFLLPKKNIMKKIFCLKVIKIDLVQKWNLNIICWWWKRAQLFCNTIKKFLMFFSNVAWKLLFLHLST